MKYFFMLIPLLWIVSCTNPASTEPETTNSETTRVLTVEARPSAIPADGISHMTIFVEYRIDGLPVEDSTRVILLNPMGVLAAGTVFTTNGVALDTLTADSAAGLGWLIVYADGLRDSTEIMFTENTP
ncbi:MAG: hypothetical protein KDB65_09505 [Calditrichaeota bacterium]|nr:hypothetical protein [Calditrichota bacterium]MCB9369424.1 hypothetical protein [Calditrichota bacterium]